MSNVLAAPWWKVLYPALDERFALESVSGAKPSLTRRFDNLLNLQ